jgi:hypothetical protein
MIARNKMVRSASRTATSLPTQISELELSILRQRSVEALNWNAFDAADESFVLKGGDDLLGRVDGLQLHLQHQDAGLIRGRP